ncbi:MULTISPECIES: DUF885 domain-containing protein [Sorangium]|uniref:DUF885 domain-containing protein n=1 Tax=Sorangium cellulosum TaxID=56 RepID=A0A4P2QYC1_SORCE|nr:MULTISPECIES: DUF885 domain-containing protein [Sorangium]AUX35584.1 hypothetical protein SOCE836_077790 [Sorangium cellulosum]WCQ94884.1 hypothetical protein NQZ70_07657 [Sorangium sp. Soce836]
MRHHGPFDAPSSARRPRRGGLLLLVALLCACGSAEPAVPPPAQPGAKEPVVSAADARPGAGDAAAGAEQALAALSARVLEEYLRDEPVRATEAGDHRYDGAWPDITEQGEAARRRTIERALSELTALPLDRLGLQSRVDAAMIDNQLRSWLFAIDELREATWNPMIATGLVGDGLDPLITRSFAPLEERMRSLEGRLSGIPALVRSAQQRLTGAPPRIHTETAIAQNQGLIALCKAELPALFASAPAQKAELEAAAKAAAAALEGFQAFLEKDLLPRSNGDFRLGRARFEKKLRFALDDASVDIDGVVTSARALLAATHAEMLETSRELWPELFGKQPFPRVEAQDEKMAAIRKVLDAIAADRPTNATIVKASERLLAEATDFVRKRDLVRVPEEPCRVIEMPEYRRGVAIAYCDASGPLEAKQETVFAIAPTPKDWPKARVDSFYREYNMSMLADLTIHEAMPGHFLQLMHNNAFPSKFRAVFSSGPFVEGWAVYTEWLMAHHGFGGPKVRMQRQKMVLRMAANAIIDHGVHAGAMDEKEAIALMTRDAFQEEGEAVGKWRRARLTSAQLTTYFHGFTEMMRLRAEHQGKPGFTERAYHDRLLSHGSPSVRHLRALLSE